MRSLGFLLVLCTFFGLADSYSNGNDDCSTPGSGHGTAWATNTGQITFSLKDASGNSVTSYQGGGVYTITMQGAAGFRGWSWAVFSGATTPTSFSAAKVGTMAVSDANSRKMTACAGGLTQVTNALLTSTTARWTAPAAGTGTVTAYAMVVITKSQANYKVVLSVPEAAAAPSASSSPAAPSASASSSAAAASQSNTPAPSASPSSSVAPSSSPIGSPTPSPSGAAPSTSSSPTASLTSGVSASGTATKTPSRSATSSRSPSITSTASPYTVLPSASASPVSPTGTSSPSASGSASIPASASTSPAALVSPSSAASASPVGAATAVPAAASAFPSATAISNSLTMRWRVDAAGADAGGVPSVTYRFESTGAGGPVWLSLNRGDCNGMFSRGLSSPRACTAPAVTGVPLDGSIAQYLISGQTLNTIFPVDPSQFTVTNASITYEAGTDTSVLVYTRPLAATGHASELPVNPLASDGYIFAVGGDAGFGMHTSCGYFTVRLQPPTCSRAGTCSGHGSCAADGVSCVCDVGYTGPACGQCALGFTPAGVSGSWCALSPLEVSSNVAVKVTLRLLLNFSMAGDPGTPARAGFVTALVGDIARALGVTPSRFNVTGLRSGSIVADVVVLPPAPSTTATDASLSAPALAQQLATMAVDPTSALYASSSQVSSALDAATPLVFDSFAAMPGVYPFTIPLGGGLTLSWRIQGAAIAQQLSYNGQNGPVWISAGVGPSWSMIGGDVMTYEPGKLAGTQVNQWMMVSRASSGVYPLPSAALLISAVSVTQGSGGAVSVEWTRPLAAGAYGGAMAIPASGPVTMMWGIGAPGQMTMGRHTNADAGSVVVDLSTGAYSATGAPNKKLWIAHGAIQFAAWGLLAPIGVLIARYGRLTAAPAGVDKPVWFYVHLSLQGSAAILSIVGFAIARSMVLPGAHFRSAHQIIGLIVFILGLLQPAAALFRPYRGALKEEVSCQRRAWEIAHRTGGYVLTVAGIVSVFLGLARFGAAPVLSAAYGTFVAALVCFGVWQEVARHWWQPAVPAAGKSVKAVELPAATPTGSAASAQYKPASTEPAAGGSGSPIAWITPSPTVDGAQVQGSAVSDAKSPVNTPSHVVTPQYQHSHAAAPSPQRQPLSSPSVIVVPDQRSRPLPAAPGKTERALPPVRRSSGVEPLVMPPRGSAPLPPLSLPPSRTPVKSADLDPGVPASGNGGGANSARSAVSVEPSARSARQPASLHAPGTAVEMTHVRVTSRLPPISPTSPSRGMDAGLGSEPQGWKPSARR